MKRIRVIRERGCNCEMWPFCEHAPNAVETTGGVVKHPSEPTCARCGEPLANCTCAAAEILGAVVEALDELDQHPQTDLHLASCASCMLAHDKALPDGGGR
jgi:hypothetical protein